MKKLLVFILPLLSLNCSSKYDSIQLKKEGLSGNVKQVIETKYRIKKESDNSIKLDTFLIKTFDYENGVLIKSVINSLKSNNIYNSKYIYNSKNQLIKEIGENNDLFKIELNYSYDDSLLIKIEGKGTDIKSNMESHLLETYNYDFDKGLKKCKSENYVISLDTKDTTLGSIGQFIYDSNDLLIEAEWNEIDTSILSSKILYYRNDNGLLTKKKEFDSNGLLKKTSTFEYEFDRNGSWIKSKEYSDDNLINLIERKIKYW